MVYLRVIKVKQLRQIAMKFFAIPLFLMAVAGFGQQWQAEVMVGASGYNGDLTQSRISLKNIGPAVNVNVKYDFDNTIIIRAGISRGQVAGADKNNTQPDLKARNLNFKSTILEGSLCAEVNALDPDYFFTIPYFFAGVGIFHFDPYTYDNQHIKTYLQPLGTEGQGLAEYPKRKPYRLTQFCVPVGGGVKINISKRLDVVYELGYRVLMTDYLDDVSTTYADMETLLAQKGPKTAELAIRQEPASGRPLPRGGDIRGNPKVNDSYFFTGIKLVVGLTNRKP